jgi:CRISPR-associated protein Cas2
MTASDAHSYLVAYDIVNDRRRDRVAKRLQAYGDRLQYSVFWVRASPAKLIRLQASMVSLINQKEDSLLICDLGLASAGASGRITVLGRSRPLTDDGALVV